MAIERLDDAGKVRERSGQPIDLVDYDYVDAACTDIAQQLLKSGALHRSP